ncbi:MAG: putative membrane protein [Candidatus Omnitrophota bacterium]|jgi:uncharacterized membrane protein
MKSKILYCGDEDLNHAAKYLACVLKFLNHKYDYVRSNDKIPSKYNHPYALVILSDYPSARWSKKAMQLLKDNIYAGSSLLMIGGWGSFSGNDGNYAATSLAEALPVKIKKTDDRCQGSVAYRIRRTTTKNNFGKLDFKYAPTIAGFNHVQLKKTAHQILAVDTLKNNPKTNQLVTQSSSPLLAYGEYGLGRVATLMTDLAPHWSGGFVDWGHKRHDLKIAPKIGIDVGVHYIQFIEELIGSLL